MGETCLSCFEAAEWWLGGFNVAGSIQIQEHDHDLEKHHQAEIPVNTGDSSLWLFHEQSSGRRFSHNSEIHGEFL